MSNYIPYAYVSVITYPCPKLGDYLARECPDKKKYPSSAIRGRCYTLSNWNMFDIISYSVREKSKPVTCKYEILRKIAQIITGSGNDLREYWNC